MSSTAFQIGSAALVALGQATEVVWGAVPCKDPVLPDRLPRWNDVCVSVLWLAQQQGKLLYPPPQPAGNASERTDILPFRDMGPARADEETVAALRALDLLDDDCRWTRQAELVLWRDQPRAWDLDVTRDDRFRAAVRDAVDHMPPEIRAGIARLVSITDADVEAYFRDHRAAMDRTRAEFGPNARLGEPMTAERAVASLRFRRRGDLDWLFFRRWRLPDGWLTQEDAARALEIFHDPLAIQMRKAVVSRLYPGLRHFAE